MTRPHENDPSTKSLFSPFKLGGLRLSNRIVMAPMTRAFSPGGVPGPDVAAYYRRRAEGGVGLIITEGTWVPHPGASNNPRVPRFYGEDALAGWRHVFDEVHAVGGKIMPQLWHVGLVPPMGAAAVIPFPLVGPSGLEKAGKKIGEPMDQSQIDAVIEAFATAAVSAQALGADGIEIHGAHGYLLDQFFWEATNKRTDRYGGDAVQRTRFAVEIIEEIRRRVGPDFPISFRFSQWKQQDYEVKLAKSPQELEAFLAPLARAGVDIFHCSTRRFWLPEFEGSALNLAGWTKHLTGKPTITVGSVALDQEFLGSLRQGHSANTSEIYELAKRLGEGEFDLVAVGRSLIVNPDWPQRVQEQGVTGLRPFHVESLKSLE